MPDALERWLRVVGLRARSLFRRGVVEQELERELRSHIDLQIEEYRAAGMTADTARQAALREGHGSHVSYPQWRALEATGALRGLAGYQIESEVNWLRGDAAVTIAPMLVTGNFFDVLGVPVARGRAFDAREVRAELDPRVVVISDGFWRSAFGADSGIIGRAITLNPGRTRSSAFSRRTSAASPATEARRKSTCHSASRSCPASRSPALAWR